MKPEMMEGWLQRGNVVLRGGGLDESPDCYKRLPQVLAAHGDTIHILHTLTPLGVAMAGANEFDPTRIELDRRRLSRVGLLMLGPAGCDGKSATWVGTQAQAPMFWRKCNRRFPAGMTTKVERLREVSTASPSTSFGLRLRGAVETAGDRDLGVVVALNLDGAHRLRVDRVEGVAAVDLAG